MYRALRNGAIDLARRRHHRDDSPFDPDSLPGPRPCPGPDDRLHLAFESLGDAEREVIHLKVIDGFTFREIADLLRLPMGTVTARHRRGLDKLKQILLRSQVS